jgi:hypothetical protein
MGGEAGGDGERTVIPCAPGQSGERGLRSWMKVFWFFFSKKNKKKALLFEKRSKNFCPF